MKKIHFIFTAFALMLITMPFSSAQGNGKELLLENDKISINITGNSNVPQFQFWRTGDNKSDKYNVKFIKLFEVIDEDGDATYNPGNESKVTNSNNALASFSWVFSEVISENNKSHFNITSEGEDFTVQFRNHFDDNEASLKFDIVIEDYEFVSDDEDAMLVLAFHLIGANKNMHQEQNKIQFGGDGYLESEEEAQGGNQTIQAGISNGEDSGNNAAFISFQRFTGKLVHDPTIGFDDDTTVPGYTNIGVISVISLVSILYIVNKKRM